jgi:hypothetical protein
MGENRIQSDCEDIDIKINEQVGEKRSTVGAHRNVECLHGAVPRRLLSVKSARPKLLSANATVTNGGKCRRPRQDKLKKSLLA